MINFKNPAIAFASGFALLAGATPALARSSAHHPGYAAHAQAAAVDGVSTGRANALRVCNDKAAPLKDYLWGVTQGEQYRTCMAGHGQPE
jgi:hypothetical protein